MNKTYYAEGSVYAIDNGNHVKKDSYKLYSPDGKKLNINIDLSGEKIFVRNANVKDIVKKTQLGQIIPKRSKNPTLLNSLETLVEENQNTHTKHDKTEKENKPIVSKKTKKTKKTIKLQKKAKKSPKKKKITQQPIENKNENETKQTIKITKSKSLKKNKNPKKTPRKNKKSQLKAISPPADSAPPLTKALSNSFISDKFL
jgi:hypothetical protein